MSKFNILFESIMNGFKPKDNPGVVLGYKPVLKSDGTIKDEKLFSRSSIDYKPVLSDEDKELLKEYCFELDPIDLDDPDNDIIHIKLFSVKADMTAPPIYDFYCYNKDRNRVIEIIEKKEENNE